MVDYGSHAAAGAAAAHPAKTAFSFAHRRRANVPAILLSLFVPWGVFAGIFAATSFSIRYDEPWLCWLIVACGATLVLATVWLSGQAVHKRMSGASQREPSWFVFWTVSMVIGFAAALLLGSVNYWSNTRPYCEINNLTAYQGVNPATATGEQLIDAGRVTFTDDAHIDLKRFMAFKNVDQYCVAPVAPGNGSNKVYDMWVVGLNCCATDFHCGDYANLNAHAGLRLMREDQRQFYTLAVQQAEAAYNINAPHPVFFFWMQDPLAELGTYQGEALKYYLLGISAGLAFQITAVILALVTFRKLGLD